MKISRTSVFLITAGKITLETSPPAKGMYIVQFQSANRKSFNNTFIKQ